MLSKDAQKMLDYIKLHRGTTFAELEKVVATDGDSRDWAVQCPGHSNLIFWVSTESFVRSFTEISHLLRIDRTMPLIYAIDGRMLKMRIAKNVREYRHPRWMPVEMSVL